MTVIDFRLRPPTNEYKASFESLAARIGIKMPDSWNNSSLDLGVIGMLKPLTLVDDCKSVTFTGQPIQPVLD